MERSRESRPETTSGDARKSTSGNVSQRSWTLDRTRECPVVGGSRIAPQSGASGARSRRVRCGATSPTGRNPRGPPRSGSAPGPDHAARRRHRYPARAQRRGGAYDAAMRREGMAAGRITANLPAQLEEAHEGVRARQPHKTASPSGSGWGVCKARDGGFRRRGPCGPVA